MSHKCYIWKTAQRDSFFSFHWTFCPIQLCKNQWSIQQNSTDINNLFIDTLMAILCRLKKCLKQKKNIYFHRKEKPIKIRWITTCLTVQYQKKLSHQFLMIPTGTVINIFVPLFFLPNTAWQGSKWDAVQSVWVALPQCDIFSKDPWADLVPIPRAVWVNRFARSSQLFYLHTKLPL